MLNDIAQLKGVGVYRGDGGQLPESPALESEFPLDLADVFRVIDLDDLRSMLELMHIVNIDFKGREGVRRSVAAGAASRSAGA